MKLHYPWLAALAVALAGCASTPPTTLLTLPPAALAATASPADATATNVIELGRVQIPEYLSSRRVRYRVDASALGEWPDTVWGERIEIGVAREMAAALQQSLHGWRVCTENCSEQSPGYLLQVAFSRMDFMRSARQLTATARIDVWSKAGPARLARTEERSYIIAAEDDSARSQASAMTQLLQRVAADATLFVPSGH